MTERPLALDPAALDAAFALARRQVEEGDAPFTIVAVATSAGLVRAEATPGPRAPRVDVDAVCLLASITKPIVAIAVMQLVAEGRLGLLDGIERHIPEFARPGKPAVTAWHLLSHTSGLPDYDLVEIATGRLDHAALGRGLKTAIYNYMHGLGLDADPRSWFEKPAARGRSAATPTPSR